YRGRFAPSPSGPLHDGSLLTAMASYLDARAHHGPWLLRIEDIDTPRVVAGADAYILQQLQTLGMHWGAAPVWQSARLPPDQAASAQLQAGGPVDGCACTRSRLPDGPYPGTCRTGLAPGQTARAWRLGTAPGPNSVDSFTDRGHGPQT